MLVGKAIEHARMEVIESHEAFQLKEQKGIFKQEKEAMLIQTQRLEEARNRKNEEVNRRNLQARTNLAVTSNKEKQQIARQYAQQFLRFFKSDCLTTLTDMGCLRDRRTYSMQKNFYPQLHK